jgi:hypothetical protein
VDPRDLFRGEFVRLDTPATTLLVEGTPGEASDAPRVRPVGRWWGTWAEVERASGALVFVQLEPAPGSDEMRPVSISRGKVPGAVNLRGRIRGVTGATLRVDYGLDAFYMQEGTARPVEQAMREGRRVQMEVAIAASGRARIRALRVGD